MDNPRVRSGLAALALPVYNVGQGEPQTRDEGGHEIPPPSGMWSWLQVIVESNKKDVTRQWQCLGGVMAEIEMMIVIIEIDDILSILMMLQTRAKMLKKKGMMRVPQRGHGIPNRDGIGELGKGVEPKRTRLVLR